MAKARNLNREIREKGEGKYFKMYQAI